MLCIEKVKCVKFKTLQGEKERKMSLEIYKVHI